MILRGILAGAWLAAAVYGGLEIRRWSVPATQGLLSISQKRRRVWGLILLLLSLGLFLGGTFLPAPHNPRETLHALIYWTVTVLLAVPLVPLALLDARENLLRLMEGREQLARERRAIAQDYLSPGADNASSKPPPVD